MWPSLRIFLVFGVLAVTSNAKDSGDCLMEYNNQLVAAAGSTSAFCDRCQNEQGSNPLRLRCSLCESKCPQNNDLVCSLNGIESVDSLTDSVLFIWAAVERCDKHHDAVQCSVDVSSAIESVTHMITYILKTVQSCGGALKGGNAKCGIAVGELTASLAGISAKSSGIVEHCPNEHKPLHIGTEKGLFQHKFAHCLIDIKSLLKNVFKAVVTMMPVKDSCTPVMQDNCQSNVMKVVAALASMGEYIAGAVGHCSTPVNEDAACAGEVLGLLRELSDLGKAGKSMSQKCWSAAIGGDSRLYNDADAIKAPVTASNHLITIGLVSFIPVTAFLSFAMGRRMQASTSTRAISRSFSRSDEALEMLGVNVE